MIRFFCIHCGAQLRAKARAAGEEVSCPYCHELTPAPEASADDRITDQPNREKDPSEDLLKPGLRSLKAKALAGRDDEGRDLPNTGQDVLGRISFTIGIATMLGTWLPLILVVTAPEDADGRGAFNAFFCLCLLGGIYGGFFVLGLLILLGFSFGLGGLLTPRQASYRLSSIGIVLALLSILPMLYVLAIH